MKIKNKTIQICFILILTGLCLYFSAPFFLKHTAQYLVDTKHDTHNPVDAIIILAGDEGERVNEAVQRFHKNQAPLVFITGNSFYGISVPQVMKEDAIKQGIPSQNIIIESESNSTKDHPQNLLPLLEKHNVKNILIITSTYHSKRAYKTFSIAFRDKPINIFIAKANDSIKYDAWWKDHESAQVIFLELGKTLWYWLKNI